MRSGAVMAYAHEEQCPTCEGWVGVRDDDELVPHLRVNKETGEVEFCPGAVPLVVEVEESDGTH